MSKELGGIVKAWEATKRKSNDIQRKRGTSNIVFPTMSMVDEERDNSNNNVKVDVGEVIHTEKFFSSGDIYIGQWAQKLSAPHGHGKYLWTDGCIYVGDWSKGIATGRGKFSWPSGATYEGVFKNGNIEGEGIYMGSSNETYKGSWVMNMKHGKGIETYDNGDQYEGEWRCGLQEGQGKYQWSNGNQYIGYWKNGKMRGSGTLIWSNGNRYDGCWEDGYPRGNGSFRWVDGSFYVGMWNKDPKDQSGTYYPLTPQLEDFDWDPQEVYSVELSDCVICRVEKVTIQPPDKMVFEWSKSEERERLRHNQRRRKGAKQPRRLSLDGVRMGNGKVHNWGSDSEVLKAFAGRELDEGFGLEGGKQIKKQGEAIYKGHKNYELMLNLQLGIRHSVGRPAPTPSLDLKPAEFDTQEKIWTKFPPEGSKQTPPHQSAEFKWKDYCPFVFRLLRKLFNVDPADYMLSICGNDALRELSSPGKSGSFFYLTADDKYMIKTMKKSEVKALKRMLPTYYNHFREFEDSLVTKFYGLHCVKLGPAQKKVRFVIMGSLFRSEYGIHRRYDLKGSSLGRTTCKSEDEIDDTVTLKDLDLTYIFRLHKDWFHHFCRQVDRDCDFLEQERIMDYSLLIGIHFLDRDQDQDEDQDQDQDQDQNQDPEHHSNNTTNKAQASEATTQAGNENEHANDSEEAVPQDTKVDADPLPEPEPDPDPEPEPEPSSDTEIRLGTNMPARAEHTKRSCETQLVGEPTGEFFQVILYFGIIDILQDYDISKKLEHAYKSIQYDPTSISAVDPKQYSRRFRDFIFRIFTEDS